MPGLRTPWALFGVKPRHLIHGTVCPPRTNVGLCEPAVLVVLCAETPPASLAICGWLPLLTLGALPGSAGQSLPFTGAANLSPQVNASNFCSTEVFFILMQSNLSNRPFCISAVLTTATTKRPSLPAALPPSCVSVRLSARGGIAVSASPVGEESAGSYETWPRTDAL